MNTQKETARAIVKQARGDYCLALKEIMAADGRYLKEIEKTSCGMVTREYFITDNISWFADRKDWALDIVFKEDKLRSKEKTGYIILV